jgi:hypothetical protein
MSATELLGLAKRLVALDEETVEVRRAMLAALSNGADPTQRPTQAPARSKPGPKGASHPNRVKAQAAEHQIVALLKDKPGMGTAALAEATSSKANTTTERLRRLKDRGLVAPAEDGGYRAL